MYTLQRLTVFALAVARSRQTTVPQKKNNYTLAHWQFSGCCLQILTYAHLLTNFQSNQVTNTTECTNMCDREREGEGEGERERKREGGRGGGRERERERDHCLLVVYISLYTVWSCLIRLYVGTQG